MALPGQPPEGGPTDALEELIACLEVLAEFVDGETVLTPGNIEFVSACAQVCELVPLLIEENQQAWECIDGLKEMAMVRAANMNRAERRALRRSSGGILLPE